MPDEHRDLDLLQVVVLGGLGVLFVGSGLVYATAAVGGLLFHGQLPDLALSDASTVVVNLPRHLAEPRDATAVHAALRPLEHDLLCGAVRAIAGGEVRLDPQNPRRVLVGARDMVSPR